MKKFVLGEVPLSCMQCEAVSNNVLTYCVCEKYQTTLRHEVGPSFLSNDVFTTVLFIVYTKIFPFSFSVSFPFIKLHDFVRPCYVMYAMDLLTAF